jgi:hypothetical protein
MHVNDEMNVREIWSIRRAFEDSPQREYIV